MEEKTDLRIVKTYKALGDAFMELLEEKSFDHITVNELCDRAMVRRATFYKHFADKYDFFAFFIRQIRDGFNKEKAPYQENGCFPEGYYIYLFRECIHFIKQHEKLVKNVLKSNMLGTLIEILSDEIYKDVLLNLKRQEKMGVSYPTSVETMASLFSGGIIQTLRFWLNGQNPVSEEKLVEGVEYLLRAVAATWIN